MPMNSIQIFLTILTMAIGTVITRFISFWLFPANKETPKYIVYLGKVLPYSVMGMLIVYCLKNVSLIEWSHGIPEFTAIALTAVLHIWKKNMMVSISAGTIFYMILIQFVFV